MCLLEMFVLRHFPEKLTNLNRAVGRIYMAHVLLPQIYSSLQFCTIIFSFLRVSYLSTNHVQACKRIGYNLEVSHSRHDGKF